MATPQHSRLRRRLSAATLVTIIAAATLLTYLSYTDYFSSTDTVTILAPRAGLVMDDGAKVKYLGLQVGKVSSITYQGAEAKLTTSIESSRLRALPSNVTVRIGSNTVFGAKAVEFLRPDQPSNTPLRPGATLQASAVQVEVNTLFQSLSNLLGKVDPIQLNATVSALAQGLRDNGDNFGAALAGMNSYLGQLNPQLPTLESDVDRAAAVANIYADAAPDLAIVTKNASTLSNTIVEQRDNLNATLLATTALANNGFDTLAPAQDDLIAAFHRLRAPLIVLADYSPGFGCLFKASSRTIDKFGPVIGGLKPGVFASASFLPGVPAYTYPESLPIVNAGGGPNCRGLPDMPSKQLGGSWYKAPFLVTDNAYIPFQPNTELQFDPPSTFQFLFNGIYAERDEY